MPRNHTVAPGHEFNYPADAASEAAIKKAGGRSKMASEDLAKLKFKTARGGDDCSDMPKEALKLYIERGQVLVNAAPLKDEEKDGD